MCNLSFEKRLELLKQFKEVIVKSRDVYNAKELLPVRNMYSIAIPKDIEPTLKHVNQLLDNDDNDAIIELTDILITYLNNSSKAILGRKDFTAFYARGCISYFVDPFNGEVYTYNVTKVIIDLGMMMKMNEKKISRFIRNAYNRLVEMLAIMGYERAIDLKSSNEYLEGKLMDDDMPKTIQSVIEDHLEHITSQVTNTKRKDTDRSLITSMLRNVINDDSFDAFVSVITGFDLETHHSKIIAKSMLEFTKRFKSYISVDVMCVFADMCTKHSKLIVDALICPVSEYGTQDRNSKILNCIQKIVSDLPPNTVKQGIIDYILRLKVENVGALFDQLKSTAMDTIGDNPMSLDSLTTTKTITRVQYKR